MQSGLSLLFIIPPSGVEPLCGKFIPLITSWTTLMTVITDFQSSFESHLSVVVEIKSNLRAEWQSGEIVTYFKV